jgi:hypothetical protein
MSSLPRSRTFNANMHIYRADMFLAINDCLLRNRYRARYTAFMDIDELMYFNRSAHASLVHMLHALFNDNDTGKWGGGGVGGAHWVACRCRSVR